MEEVGLNPSDTAQPGGKRTGQSVSHYIVEDGPGLDPAADETAPEGVASDFSDPEP